MLRDAPTLPDAVVCPHAGSVVPVEERSREPPYDGSVAAMTYTPTISCQADLEEAWRHLMQPLGFSGPSLWFMAVTPDDRAFPHLTQIEDCHRVPAPEEVLSMVAGVGAILDDVAPGARIAFLRTRPGRGGVDAEDRAWARALYGAARATGVALEVVHLATDRDVWPLPADAA